MKKFFPLFFLLGLYAGRLSAQGIQMRYKDGREFTPETAMLADDTCLFTLPGGTPARWSLHVLQQRMEEPPVWTKCAEQTKSTHLEFCPRQCDFPWWSALQTTDAGAAENVYYRGMLRCEQKGRTDTAYIRFNLAPTKPVIREFRFTYDAFDYDSGDFINSSAEYWVESSRAKEFVVRLSEYHPEERGDYHFRVWHFDVGERIEGDLFRIVSDFTWDQKIFLYAKNAFGISLHSDTLYTTNYIQDKEILAFIRDELTGTGVLGTDDEAAIFSHGTVRTQFRARHIHISDLNGRIWKEGRNISSLSLTDLPKGTYIAIITKENGHRITKKIML